MGVEAFKFDHIIQYTNNWGLDSGVPYTDIHRMTSSAGNPGKAYIITYNSNKVQSRGSDKSHSGKALESIERAEMRAAC